MSVSELATVILLICGQGESDKHFDCYDYYNNCVVDAGMTLNAVKKCEKNHETGLNKILKLKEKGYETSK